ncbi:glucokinase [Halomonas sp. Bachu 37]|uniref:glucokinase n=1 Tax=Halomonas kashgarensis TaxID=3084920 RepID=UPI003216CBFE
MTRLALIGDIGGTNARFALVTPGEAEPRHVHTLPSADYPGPVEAARDYLALVGLNADDAPREACLAFACPVDGDRMSMTNGPWAFSRRAVQQTLGLSRFKAINDFTAQALGVTCLAPGDIIAVKPGKAKPDAVQLAFGPGTGLGVAGLFPGRHWHLLPSEGGHVAFAATDAHEHGLLRHFQRRYDRVSVERILSGPGLLELYLAHCSLAGTPPRCAFPAEVTVAADEGDALARETLLRFLKILGDICGDAALTLGARGGVTLCGGILPRLRDWLPKSRFAVAFAAKGRMSAYTAAIPVRLAVSPWTGLLGAAAALRNPQIH